MMQRISRYLLLPLLAAPLLAHAQRIASLLPSTVTAGSASFALTVSGSGFVYGDSAYLDGVLKPTIVSSDSLLRVLIYNTDIAKAGKHTIVVKSESGAASNALPFTVTGTSQPPPPNNRVTVAIASPTASEVTCSPITLSASASTGNAGASITRWQVHNKAGTLLWASSSPATSIRPQLTLATGSQTLVVEAWDSTNIAGTASVTFSVSTSSTVCGSKPSGSGSVKSWHACMRHADGHEYQAMEFSLSPGGTLPFNATLYTGLGCNTNNWLDQFGFGTPVSFGGFTYTFWFEHHPDLPNSSVIWTVGNQNSGCVNYNNVPPC